MSSGDTIFILPATAFVGDNEAQLVTGDIVAAMDIFKTRPVLSYDDTDEEAAISCELPVPSHYGGGGIKAICHFFMASDNTNDIALDVFVESKTPNSDTLDLEAATSWDSANSGTVSLSGSTAGDPLTLTITLTNNDSIAVGDLVRFGIRRDCDSVNDDATGDLYLASVEIQEV